MMNPRGPRLAIFLVLAAMVAVSSGADARSKGKKRVSKLPEGVNLQTDIQFSGSTLSGKYQTPTEALAKVEQEKSLNDLLIPRTHFKDRLVKQR